MKVRELGHVVLYVGDVGKSAAFYHDILGWDLAIPPSPGSPIAAFSGGRTHHELLLIEVGEDAAPQPRGRHKGLYHVGLKIGDTDDDLREAADRLAELGVPILGASDHTISHGLYLRDLTATMSSCSSMWPGSTGRPIPASSPPRSGLWSSEDRPATRGLSAPGCGADRRGS